MPTEEVVAQLVVVVTLAAALDVSVVEEGAVVVAGVEAVVAVEEDHAVVHLCCHLFLSQLHSVVAEVAPLFWPEPQTDSEIVCCSV